MPDPKTPKRSADVVTFDRDEVAPRILSIMLDEGRSLRSVCREEGMPAPSTFLDWVREDPELAEQYARARDGIIDAEFDEIKTIPDNATETPEGIAKAKLQMDARKWRLSKMRPLVYGEQTKAAPAVAVQINNTSAAPSRHDALPLPLPE